MPAAPSSIAHPEPERCLPAATLDARKMVGGEEQEMGVLGCRLVSPKGRLTCAMPRGVWHFNGRNDSLTGELLLLDNTRVREVRAVRAP